MMNPEAMIAAAAHVRDEYVHGCTMTSDGIGGTYGTKNGPRQVVNVFTAWAPDGGTFWVAADQFGNVASASIGSGAAVLAVRATAGTT